jgi:hypothetical protein
MISHLVRTAAVEVACIHAYAHADVPGNLARRICVCRLSRTQLPSPVPNP